MAPEPTTFTDGDKQKTLDQEVRELISTLTNRLASIQSSQKSGGGSSTQSQDEDENGVRVITLAGNNLGATMRGDMMDEKPAGPQGLSSLPEHEDFATYVNSNFQAINNSIMLGGSYNTNDPGVHLDISDYVDHHDAPLPKRGNKGKELEKGSSRNGHTITQHSE
ncbi:hypothetical protein BUALT_Bualt10G0000900 [Buddleja alternifolia]|uniref:Uncharacterized protein n=1 Tax=Buddleja alternifolia TaxID=168488 RepID=A0AAV6WVN9_9LAMI|nr:hypothetical protein BUALT_Bualt10G0000900 [Buddleja alternifolia]